MVYASPLEETSADDLVHPAWPKRDYGAIIFDCDGTLTDSMPVHYLAWHRTMTSYEFDFRKISLRDGGIPSDKIIQILAAEQTIEIDSPGGCDRERSRFLEHMHLLTPIEAVLRVARTFRGRIPLAVASGGYRDVILNSSFRSAATTGSIQL